MTGVQKCYKCVACIFATTSFPCAFVGPFRAFVRKFYLRICYNSALPVKYFVKCIVVHVRLFSLSLQKKRIRSFSFSLAFFLLLQYVLAG